MSDHVNAPEPIDELIREGCGSYLDALYALHRFRRAVIDAAMDVWKAKLEELAGVIGTPALRPEDVVSHCNPNGLEEGWSGNWALIMCKHWFPQPWRARYHLGLSFEREQNGHSMSCSVKFLVHSERVEGLNALREAFGNDEGYWEDRPSQDCGFSRPIENCMELSRDILRDQFNIMMDYVIDRWRCKLPAPHNTPS
jgi:hypothetical protein